MVSKLRQTPRFLEAAAANVEDPPGIFIKTGAEMFDGVVTFIERDLSAGLQTARRPAPARRSGRCRHRGDGGDRPLHWLSARHPGPPKSRDVSIGAGTVQRPAAPPRGNRPGSRGAAGDRGTGTRPAAEPVLRGRGPNRPQGGAGRCLAPDQGAAPGAGDAGADGARPAHGPRIVHRTERPGLGARRSIDCGGVDPRFPALDPGRRLAPPGRSSRRPCRATTT